MRISAIVLAVTFSALLGLGPNSCLAKQTTDSLPNLLHHVALPAPPLSALSSWEPSAVISPNGRWVAYFDSRLKKGERVIFYNTQSKLNWAVNVGSSTASFGATRLLLWRADSSACAIGATGGWQVAYPEQRRKLIITRRAPQGEVCAAWSPLTKRLAIFDYDKGDGILQVWNGRNLTKPMPWRIATGFPYRGEERSWQCEWSPDEKSLLFRFYGHAERDSISSGHTNILNPRTGRPRYKWGTEAGPAHWLDNSRIIFAASEFGSGGATGPVVENPASGHSQKWMRVSYAHTLSARRDVVWAIDDKGDLYRSPTKKRQWTLIRRRVLRVRPNYYPRPMLTLSPRGDMIAMYDAWDGKSLSIVSTSKKKPWAVSWRPPSGTIKVIGWAAGGALPLLEWQQRSDGPGIMVQLAKSG